MWRLIYIYIYGFICLAWLARLASWLAWLAGLHFWQTRLSGYLFKKQTNWVAWKKENGWGLTTDGGGCHKKQLSNGGLPWGGGGEGGSRTIKLLRVECFPSRGTDSNANFAQRKRGRRTLVCFSACFTREQLFAPLVEENVRWRCPYELKNPHTFCGHQILWNKWLSKTVVLEITCLEPGKGRKNTLEKFEPPFLQPIFVSPGSQTWSDFLIDFMLELMWFIK